MGDVEVAVAVPYPPFSHPLVEQGGIVADKAIGVVLDALVCIARDSVANVFFCLGEVLLGVLGDGIKAAEGTDSGAGFCPVVEVCQLFGQHWLPSPLTPCCCPAAHPS